MAKPAAPSSFSLSVISSTTLRPLFVAPAGTVTGYRLRFSTDPEFRRARVITLNFTVTVPDLIGLNQGTTYYAQLWAYNGDGEGAMTSVVGATTTAVAGWPQAHLGITVSPPIAVIPKPILEFYDGAAQTVAGYPMSNLIRPTNVAVHRQVGAELDIRFRTGGTPIDFIALLGTNIPNDAIFNAYYADSAAELISAPTAAHLAAFRASTLLPSRPGYHGYGTFGASSKPWWRIKITSAVGTNVWEAAHLVVGSRILAAKNYSRGKAMDGQDLGSFEINRDGSVGITNGVKLRQVEFDLSYVNEASYRQMFGDLWQRVGTSTPVLLIPNSKAGPYLHDEMLYGPMRGGRETHEHSKHFSKSFQLLSMI